MFTNYLNVLVLYTFRKVSSLEFPSEEERQEQKAKLESEGVSIFLVFVFAQLVIFSVVLSVHLFLILQIIYKQNVLLEVTGIQRVIS